MRRAATLLLLFAPAIAHAAGGKSGGGGGMAGAVMQMFASLAVVIGIIYLLYYASNRWFKGLTIGKSRSGMIRVVETRHLAPKRSLIIVEVAGEYLLLGNSNEGMNLIKKLESPSGIDDSEPETTHQDSPEAFLRKFSGMLDRSLSGIQTLLESEPRKNREVSKRYGGCQ